MNCFPYKAENGKKIFWFFTQKQSKQNQWFPSPVQLREFIFLIWSGLRSEEGESGHSRMTVYCRLLADSLAYWSTASGFFFINEFHIFIKLRISFFLLFETYFKYFVLWRPGNWYNSFQIKEDGKINYFFFFLHLERLHKN